MSPRRLAAAAGSRGTLERAGDVSDADAASFEHVRQRLFGIAYRVLGSATDADDVVQDAWIRWHRTDRTEVRDTASFLATTTTRLAINVIHSARARRETHVEPKLLDRVDARADPLLDAQRGEALELAVGALLEKLSPAERAVYVLREAFDYPYRKVSEVLPLTEANARQLVTRARRHLAGEQRRPIDPRERQRFLDAFAVAAKSGELARLERLLIADMARGEVDHATAHSMRAGSRATMHLVRGAPRPIAEH
jgi:RNA polymerase sigma-70 factor, ECF subfamily